MASDTWTRFSGSSRRSPFQPGDFAVEENVEFDQECVKVLILLCSKQKKMFLNFFFWEFGILLLMFVCEF